MTTKKLTQSEGYIGDAITETLDTLTLQLSTPLGAASSVHVDCAGKVASLVLLGNMQPGELHLNNVTQMDWSGATMLGGVELLLKTSEQAVTLKDGISKLTLPNSGKIASITSAPTNWPNVIQAVAVNAGDTQIGHINLTATELEGSIPPGNVQFIGQSLDAASVSALLAFYANLQGVDLSTLTLDISGGSTVAPNATTDAANIAAIQAAGGTVIHN